MKNLKNFTTFNENYPPGAEHDSRAPWNQKDPSYEHETFDDVIENENGDKIPVTIKYSFYYEDPNSIRKHISSYEHEFKADASSLNPEYIDEDVRSLIENNIGDRYYDWEC